MYAVMSLGLLIIMTTAAPGDASQSTSVSLADSARDKRSVLDLPAQLRVTDMPRLGALTRLAQTSGVGLAFSSTLLSETNQVVTCDCHEATVRQALDRILVNAPLRYRVLDGQVVITPFGSEAPLRLPRTLPPLLLAYAMPALSLAEGRLAARPPTEVAPALPQTRIITGRVADSLTGDVVTSGQVSLVGSTISSRVGDDGTFTISAPARDVTLTVRSVGFKRRDLPVSVSTSSVRVSLERDYFQLEAIVVTGQATGVERKNLANAVASVTAEQLASVPATSIDQALQGKLAGATIIQHSGAPGGGGVVTLRGVTSINGAFTPLYVIDGVIASDVALPRGSNYVTQSSRGLVVATAGENAVNRIADLNPNDIENVEVLKGAAASAIYGSKASNGVVLITTKRGRVGTPQFTVSQRVGVSAISKRVGSRTFPSLADAVSRYGALGADPVVGWAPGKVFDNEGSLAGNRPLSYETSASMSGGTETTQYYASALVKHEGGIVTNTFADKRSLRVNVDQNVARRLTVAVGADVLNSSGDKGVTNNENNNSSYWAALSNTPSFFDLRGTCDGVPTTKPRCGDGTVPLFAANPYVASNPVHTAAVVQNREEVWRIIATGRVALDAISGSNHTLRFIANGGVDFFHQANRVFSPPELEFEALDGLLGTSVASSADNLNYNLNANGVYTYKTPGGITATTQIGMQYETRELRIDRILATNLVGGLQVVTSGTGVVVDARHEYVKDFGLFAQEEVLALGDKLLLTAGIRADQSSNNGDPGKLYYYPKASISYRLPSLARGVVDELKLRAAFGQSGNQPLYGQKYTELLGRNVGGGVPAALIQTSAAATNIVPERQREIEAGLDATLIGGRASLEVTGYEKRITDLLLARGLPRSFGFSSEFLNGGVLRTRGLETSLSLIPVQTRDWRWTSRLFFHAYRSKMVTLPVPRFGGGGGAFSGTASIRIEEGASATQVVGLDSLLDGSTVLVKIGETRPDYSAQLSTEFKYRALGLSFLLDRQKGGLLADITSWQNDQNGTSKDYDQPAPDGSGRKLGVWRPLVYRKHARMYTQDASFLKLREAAVSLDVPPSVVRSLLSGARYARITLSGRNLLTSTRYSGTDPEQRRLPERGIASLLPTEFAAYPPSRIFWFSIEVGF